jgi:hypothetical protein
MNIFRKIKSFISNKNKKIETPVNAPEISMSEREDKFYGEGQLTLQKLYEKWACKDKWLLYDEGIPLLYGLQPAIKASLDQEVLTKIESLWEHAQECVHKKLLSVINLEQPEKEWEVLPLDLYRWATVSRISLPDEFTTLMAFVSQTVMPTATASGSVQSLGEEDMLYQKHREIVLGAATSLLINAPGLCKNKKGRIVSNQIAKNIMENEGQWFGNDRPLLTESSMTDLINEYLKLSQPIV